MNRPMLVDTSVWIDYTKGTIDKRDRFFKRPHFNNVLICPIILQETLQGIRNDVDYNRVKNIAKLYHA